MNPSTETFFRVRDYNLAATLDSGQVFRWRRLDDSWIGVIGNHQVRLRQRPDGISVQTAAPVNNWDWLRGFLQTETDLNKILKSFPDDEPMKDAVAACCGLRVLRQEPWECLASFILSSTKQIVQIRQIVSQLCECFGEPIESFRYPGRTTASTLSPQRGGGLRVRGESRLRDPASPHPNPLPSHRKEAEGEQQADATGSRKGIQSVAGEPLPPDLFYAFPSAEKIAGLSERDLRNCKMGFRAPNLLAAAHRIAGGKFNLENLRQLPYARARTELMTLRGVGGKIADCVLLFAYGFDSAFPVDVWVERALRTLYFPHRRVSEKKLLHFAATRFGPHAGYAQQYLFHYMRTFVGADSLAPAQAGPF